MELIECWDEDRTPLSGGELGVTAIEYALLAALIALAMIGGASLLGTDLGATFQYVSDQVHGVM